jgi:hypothetical protein
MGARFMPPCFATFLLVVRRTGRILTYIARLQRQMQNDGLPQNLLNYPLQLPLAYLRRACYYP